MDHFETIVKQWIAECASTNSLMLKYKCIYVGNDPFSLLDYQLSSLTLSQALLWCYICIVVILSRMNVPPHVYTHISRTVINSCMTQTGLHGNAWLPCSPLWVMQLVCHPKYSILYGA